VGMRRRKNGRKEDQERKSMRNTELMKRSR